MVVVVVVLLRGDQESLWKRRLRLSRDGAGVRLEAMKVALGMVGWARGFEMGMAL